MKTFLKIAGSLCALLIICFFINSPSVPVVSVSGDLSKLSDSVIDYDYNIKDDVGDRVPMIKEISHTEKITRSFTIKPNDTLVICDGGILYIDSECLCTLLGSLKIEEGGEVYVRGAVDSKEGSEIINSGKIKVMSSGHIDLGGTLSVCSSGTVKGKGEINILNEFSDIRCKGSVTVKLNAPAPVEKDGVTYVGGVILVNKSYGLPENYGTEIDSNAYTAFIKMKQESGFDMQIVSGFRSFDTQKDVFESWCRIDGYEKASMYSAKPGHSEHQTGLAIDVTSIEADYGDTAEGKWLAENCYKYGFIIRYPKDKTDITGYIYEPWHIRYLGSSTAKLVYQSGLTLEEFFGLA